jgi:hypothetical protein
MTDQRNEHLGGVSSPLLAAEGEEYEGHRSTNVAAEETDSRLVLSR